MVFNHHGPEVPPVAETVPEVNGNAVTGTFVVVFLTGRDGAEIGVEVGLGVGDCVFEIGALSVGSTVFGGTVWIGALIDAPSV